MHHYTLNLYSRYNEIWKSFFIDGLLTGGYNQYKGLRNISYGTVAISPQAKYHGWQADVIARTGLDYNFHCVQFTPYLIAQYDYLNLQGYSETGAGSANQTVQGTSFDQFLMGVGFNIGKTWDCEQISVQPHLFATYLYAVKNATMQTTSQFFGSGPAFVTTGATPPSSQYHLGGEFTLVSQKNWDTSVGYGAQIENDFLAQTGFLRWSYRW